MKFGDVKKELRALINRKDFDLERAGLYVRLAVERLESNLRLPFMERLTTYTDTGCELILPADFLELVDIYTPSGRIEQTGMEKFLNSPDSGGVPSKFVKAAGVYLLRPAPSPAVPVWLHYYATLPPLQTDTDENPWTCAGYAAVLYGAAELAADFYEDERLGRFAEKYATAWQELDNQSQRDVWSGPITMGSAGQGEEF